MDYTEKLVIASKNYLRSSTCKCKYSGNCPQETLQSLIDDYKPSTIAIAKKKKGTK